MLKNEIYKEIINDNEFRGYDLLNYLLTKDSNFKEVITSGLRTGFIRKFNDDEWEKIIKVSYIPEVRCINSFFEMFKEGLNIGNACGTSKYLGKEYSSVDIVCGSLPVLNDVIVSDNMDHWWLETDDSIIDPSLLLIIHPLYRDKLGYVESDRFCLDKRGKYSL
jgi:hypothetical protein